MRRLSRIFLLALLPVLLTLGLASEAQARWTPVRNALFGRQAAVSRGYGGGYSRGYSNPGFASRSYGQRYANQGYAGAGYAGQGSGQRRAYGAASAYGAGLAGAGAGYGSAASCPWCQGNSQNCPYCQNRAGAAGGCPNCPSGNCPWCRQNQFQAQAMAAGQGNYSCPYCNQGGGQFAAAESGFGGVGSCPYCNGASCPYCRAGNCPGCPGGNCPWCRNFQGGNVNPQFASARSQGFAAPVTGYPSGGIYGAGAAYAPSMPRGGAVMADSVSF